jgi:pimeloyl-ACP methyl ester carboxylesterase
LCTAAVRRTVCGVPYVDVGFGSVYYEVHGQGEPVVLLHGAGFGFGAGFFAAQITDLAAAGFAVYSPERVGHARTPDREGPYSHHTMADETSAFIESVVGTPAHLVGWSDGMTVALLTVMSRPDLVNRFVGIGCFVNSDGATAAYHETVADLEAEPWPALVESYALLSPDGPEHFPIFLQKLLELMRHRPDIDLSALSTIQSPALLIQGDDDFVHVEHSAAAIRALPLGRLAVLPGSHLFPLESPELLNPLIIAFLRGRVL